jgi:lipopolysaccharide cholinephosphotransferase
MNVVFKNYHPISGNQLKQLQSVLMEILKDFVCFCDKHNLTYMLSYGSCLGAIRHNGFIPWDNDIDINMPRSDYQKFLNLFEREMSDKYEIIAPNMVKESKNNFAKIYKKETLCLEIGEENIPFPKGISIDINPLDFVPANKFLRRLKGYIIYILAKISVSSYYATYRTESLETLLKEESYKFYFVFKIRFILGKICNLFLSHKNWCNLTDKFSTSKKATLFLSVPESSEGYYKSTLPKNILLPVTKGIFENIEVSLPNNSDVYLSHIYGSDYMKIPAKNKQIQHYIIDLKFRI